MLEIGARAPLLAQARDRVEHDLRLLDRVDGAAVAPVRLAQLGVAGTALDRDRRVDRAAAGDPDLEAPSAPGTMPASARTPWATQAMPPAPVDSSSVIVFTSRSPASRTPRRASISAASTIAATPPFMSHAPRP